VLAAVRALAEPYRATVLLRYYEGLALEEVARRTGVNGSTARTRLARAHEQLRARLDREWGGRQAWGALAAPGVELGTALVAEGVGVKAITVLGLVLVGGFAWWQVAREERGPEVVREAHAGTWSVTVVAPGFGKHEETVELSSSANVLRFSLDPIEPVRGRVVDPDGRPVAGALVSEGYGRGQPVTTSPDGSFELLAEDGGLHLSATLPGFAPSELLRLVHSGKPTSEIHLLTLRRSCRFAGLVLDADGVPVARAQVMARHGTESPKQLLTESDGSFVLVDLPAGGQSVTITAGGQVQRFDVMLAQDNANAHEFRLPPR
jgi:hypothetical protein